MAFYAYISSSEDERLYPEYATGFEDREAEKILDIRN